MTMALFFLRWHQHNLRSAAGHRLNGAVINDDGGRMRFATVRQSHQHMQSHARLFKATGFQPMLHLLINQAQTQDKSQQYRDIETHAPLSQQL